MHIPTCLLLISLYYYTTWGYAVAQLVGALRYESEGRGFDSRRCHPSGRTMVDSPSNRNEYQQYFMGGKGGRCVGLTTLPPSNLGASTSWNPQGLYGPVQGLLYLYLYLCCTTYSILVNWERIETELFEIYILLTVHLDVILVNDQLDALFLNVFILCLYMFRAASAHHQEGQIVLIHHLV
jgi:hypothetical protein